MDKLTEQIKKHERINDRFLAAALISLLVSIIGLVLVVIFRFDVTKAPILKALENVADYIFDHILIWITGSIFIVFFAALAIFAFVGINIGPKETN